MFSGGAATGNRVWMTVGTSIVLIAAGAILRYAVNANSSVINIQTVGLILMIAGILGLILSLLYMALWADRTRPTRRDPYLDEPPTRRY
jgi:Na+/proline symporter